MYSAANNVQIIGGLTRDPELLEEIGLLRFSVAVDGAGRENNANATGYFDVTAWTKPSKMTAEAATENLMAAFRDGSLVRGAKVEVSGRLNHERFTKKDGTKASRVVIVADTVRVAYSKNREDNASTNNASTSDEGQAPAPKNATASGSDDGLEPF